MNKKVPFKKDLDKAKAFDTWAGYTLSASTVLLIIAIVIDKGFIDYQDVGIWINRINCLFIILYAILEFVRDNIFFHSRSKKIEDLIDNSFKSCFSEEESENYFTNDRVSPGIYKLGVNCFESSFFSYNIAKEMQTNLWIKNVIISLLFIFVGICGFNDIFVFIIQLSMPLMLLQQAIKQSMFVNRLEKILTSFRKLFNNMKQQTDRSSFVPEIILNMTEYETVLAWANILLSTSVYEKLNAPLSEKWEKMKSKYLIV